MRDLALLLSSSPLFQRTEDLVLDYALELGKITTWNLDELMIRKDEPNHGLFIILKGRVGIRLDQKRTFIDLGPLDCVGEMSMVDNSLASADVVALETVTAMEFPRDAMWELVNRSHAVACNLLIILTKRLRVGNLVTIQEAKRAELYVAEAYSDTLTGVFNRRWMLPNFGRIIRRQIKDGMECCLLFFDVDRFKDVNDSFGHKVGDQVLKRVAELAREICRPEDPIVRYAGDEFAILLPRTFLDQGFSVAKRLVKMVSEDSLLQGLTPNKPLTVSVGIASTREFRDMEALLEGADQAMYRAKDFGRNRASL